MTLKEFKEENARQCLEAFREYADDACRDIAMTCRAAQATIGKEHDTKAMFAEAAQKWFEEIDAMSEAEFDFLMLRKVFERIVGGDDDDTEDDGIGGAFLEESDTTGTCS